MTCIHRLLFEDDSLVALDDADSIITIDYDRDKVSAVAAVDALFADVAALARQCS